jgi:ligand-binding sensor domain-containing protein
LGGNGWWRLGPDQAKGFSTRPAEIHPWDVQSLAADNHGGIWTAFNANGVSYWTTNSVQDFAMGRYSNAWAVLVDKEQRVWAGTLGEGLFRLEGDRFQPAPGSEILGARIFALFEDRGGQLWVGAQNGLGCWNGRNWKLFTTRDGLSENAVRAIAEDGGGNLWVGTESRGLNLFKDGKFTAYRQEEGGLPGDDISCLYADKDGVLWVGTGGHGLARFQDGKWTRYATTNGLASDSINYIMPRMSRQFVDRLERGVDADSKAIAERFCRRLNQCHFLPDLWQGRRTADARMFRRLATRRDAAPPTADCGFRPSKVWRR